MPVTTFLVACLVALAAPQPSTEKEKRTPAQQKINSQLLYEIYRARGDAERLGVPPAPTGVKIDAQGRALVDIRVDPAPAFLRKVRAAGGAVLSTSVSGHSVIARVPLLKLESLAADPAVHAIEPAAEATTVRKPA